MTHMVLRAVNPTYAIIPGSRFRRTNRIKRMMKLNCLCLHRQREPLTLDGPKTGVAMVLDCVASAAARLSAA
jgi:hypothetical protein